MPIALQSRFTVTHAYNFGKPEPTHWFELGELLDGCQYAWFRRHQKSPFSLKFSEQAINVTRSFHSSRFFPEWPSLAALGCRATNVR